MILEIEKPNPTHTISRLKKTLLVYSKIKLHCRTLELVESLPFFEVVQII
jgi:hypothetical protein